MRPGGQPNLQQLMKQAQKMQQQLAAAQAELAEAEVTGTAGGGLVTVTMTASGEFAVGEDRPEGGRPRRRRDARGSGARRGAQRHRGGPGADRGEDGPVLSRWPAAASACRASEPPMYEGAIQDLIDELGRLPGIGPKSAQRLAFHLLQAETGRRQPAGRPR